MPLTFTIEQYRKNVWRVGVLFDGKEVSFCYKNSFEEALAYCEVAR